MQINSQGPHLYTDIEEHAEEQHTQEANINLERAGIFPSETSDRNLYRTKINSTLYVKYLSLRMFKFAVNV